MIILIVTLLLAIRCNALPYRFSKVPYLTRLCNNNDVTVNIINKNLNYKNNKVIDNKSIWAGSWLPAAIVSELDDTTINSIRILGQDLVVWKDNNSNSSNTMWRISIDSCPHRLAPLSNGYINPKTKQLTCRYHGWEFDGCGKCTYIPQAENNNAINNMRNRLTVYPVRQEQGILWLYPNTDITEDDVMRLPLPIYNDFNEDSFVSREFPMDYEVMVENSFDPSHAMFVHDGLVGFSSSKAIPMTNYTRVGNITSSGFTVVHNGYSKSNKNMDAIREFKAPYSNYVRYILPPSGLKISTMLYFVPIKPGYTRVIGGFKFIPPERGGLVRTGIQLFTMVNKVKQWLLPQWLYKGLGHISTKLEEQDIFIMHYQYNNIQLMRQKGVDWQSMYYLPTKADHGVANYRNWFQKYCNNNVYWLQSSNNNAVTAVSEDELLNRYNRHTKHCSNCMKTMKLFRLIKQIVPLSVTAQLLLLLLVKNKIIHTTKVIGGTAIAMQLLLFNYSNNIINKMMKGKHPYK